MPPAQAHALLAYLKANPEQAKQIHEQAQQLLKTPELAKAFMSMNVGSLTWSTAPRIMHSQGLQRCPLAIR